LDDLTRLAAEASSGGTLTSSGAGWGRFAPWTTTINAAFAAAGRHLRASRSSASMRRAATSRSSAVAGRLNARLKPSRDTITFALHDHHPTGR
jgi:hypothetical protein